VYNFNFLVFINSHPGLGEGLELINWFKPATFSACPKLNIYTKFQ
jgi:hypothetical protein